MAFESNNLDRKDRRAQARLKARQEPPVAGRLKKWIISVLVIVAIIGLTALAVWQSQQSGPTMPAGDLPPVGVSDWQLGQEAALITLIEYSDFECPACRAYHPIIKAVLDHFSADQLRFVYRHFPLRQHQGAIPAARATEAAGRQGQFWAMHDLIFDRQADWSGSTGRRVEEMMLDYAVELELDLEQFMTDLADPTLAAKVSADLTGGQTAGVEATPTFFLNEQMITSPASAQEFIKLIEGHLAQIAGE